ncbi:MAG: hypothetical protein C0613_11760 [Desulfobulbaceae bacterium]|nr:MAG: hypothetical protein C0613_11760 [Desulfobulbaceae bacterium]
MKIVVIGPGALGCLFSACLAANGRQVTLVDHNARRAAALANRLTLVRSDGKSSVALPITADHACLQQADLVLVTVKSAEVAEVLAALRQRVPTDCLTIGLQNGIGHLHLFRDSGAGLVPGVTAQGATLIEPGVVRHGGNGATALGFLQPQAAPARLHDKLGRVAHLLSAAGITTEVVDNIESRLWQKLLVNAGINGLTVLYDCANGQLLKIDEARARLVALVEESAHIARCKGIDVGVDPVGHALDVCRATADNISSMLQDARKGRSTEIMAINGALQAEAAKLSMPAPQNALLVQQVLQKTRCLAPPS